MSEPLLLFVNVLNEFNNSLKWNNATLGKIKTISNTKVGSVGQVFIERLCEELSLPCLFPINKQGARSTQSPWDIEINGIKYELKTATEDVNGSYQFNHIRYHRPYDAVLCLGVSPDTLYFNIWSKADIATGKAGKLVSMEKGANASYKLTKVPAQLKEISLFEAEIKAFTDTFNK